MIFGSLYSLNAKDLLSAVISYGIVGFGLVISFLILQAPDLAIVQVVVEVLTLIIMIAVIKNTQKELSSKFEAKTMINYTLLIILALGFILIFEKMTGTLSGFGMDTMRMSQTYLQGDKITKSANLVTGVIFDFRAYDTLGEATVLFTAVIGVLTILRIKGKKDE